MKLSLCFVCCTWVAEPYDPERPSFAQSGVAAANCLIGDPPDLADASEEGSAVV